MASTPSVPVAEAQSAVLQAMCSRAHREGSCCQVLLRRTAAVLLCCCAAVAVCCLLLLPVRCLLSADFMQLVKKLPGSVRVADGPRHDNISWWHAAAVLRAAAAAAAAAAVACVAHVGFRWR